MDCREHSVMLILVMCFLMTGLVSAHYGCEPQTHDYRSPRRAQRWDDWYNDLFTFPLLDNSLHHILHLDFIPRIGIRGSSDLSNSYNSQTGVTNHPHYIPNQNREVRTNAVSPQSEHEDNMVAEHQNHHDSERLTLRELYEASLQKAARVHEELADLEMEMKRLHQRPSRGVPTEDLAKQNQIDHDVNHRNTRNIKPRICDDGNMSQRPNNRQDAHKSSHDSQLKRNPSNPVHQKPTGLTHQMGEHEHTQAHQSKPKYPGNHDYQRHQNDHHQESGHGNHVHNHNSDQAQSRYSRETKPINNQHHNQGQQYQPGEHPKQYTENSRETIPNSKYNQKLRANIEKVTENVQPKQQNARRDSNPDDNHTKHSILRHQIPDQLLVIPMRGFKPSQIKISYHGDDVRVYASHSCGKGENCVSRDMENVYKLPENVDKRSLKVSVHGPDLVIKGKLYDIVNVDDNDIVSRDEDDNVRDDRRVRSEQNRADAPVGDRFESHDGEDVSIEDED